MKLTFAALFVFSSLYIFGQTTTRKTITIDPYLSLQNYEHYQRLTLSSPDSPIEFLEDFDFKWGYTYTLEVVETKLKQPYSDGTQYQFKFKKIITTEKVHDSTEFKLYISPTRYYYQLDSSQQHMNVTLEKLNDSTYLYFEKVEIVVPVDLRKKFAALSTSETGRLGRFTFIEPNRIRLIRL